MLLKEYWRANRKRTCTSLGLALLLAGVILPFSSTAPKEDGATHLVSSPDTNRRVQANLPLSFEPNAGQSDQAARFLAHAPGGTLYFTDSGVVLALNAQGSQPKGQEQAKSTSQVPLNVVRVQFVGTGAAGGVSLASQVQGGPSGTAPLPGKVNYIKGKDKSKWRTNIPTYSGVNYPVLYPGVSLQYEGDSGQLKGTYTVAAGADPSTIRWSYGAARPAVIDSEGNIVLTLGEAGDSATANTMTEHAPIAWQNISGKRVMVGVRYVKESDGTFGFALSDYDHSALLVIDPTLTYSTYLGGFYGDGAADIKVDAAGDMYVTGSTGSSDFPVANAYQPVWGGEYDAFITKFSPDGSTLIFSTFLGGGGEIDGGDNGRSIMVDAQGEVIVGGSTNATDFPTTPGAYQVIYGGSGDLFISKLTADGSDLVYSTYYGNAGVEDSAQFTADAEGNVYFIGYFEGGLNSYALLGELSADGANLIFARSLGGHVPGPGDQNANTHGNGIALDPDGNIYVTGDTRAADFPVTPGAYRTSLQAFEDGFVAKLAPGGQTILAATFIPGGVSEYAQKLALDQARNVYVTGWTSSSDFPTTPGAFQTVAGDPDDVFLTKFNPALGQLVYSTYLGGPKFDNGDDISNNIAVDGAGRAYVVGYTTSPDFPTRNAIQGTLLGAADGFITRFNASGSNVDYSTYLGGSGIDSVNSVALDAAGNAYICGGTGSNDFPTMDPFQPVAHGGGDAFIAKIFDPNGAVSPTPTRTGTPPTATPTRTATACTPSPNYNFSTQEGVSLVPGTTDIGNHCDDCITTVTLPFSIRFYGQPFNTANIGSNGDIQFVGNDPVPFNEDTCEVGYVELNDAMLPYFSDLNTTQGGIFTSISGSAPNRIFNIEWRGCEYDPNRNCTDNVDFEARLYEGSPIEQVSYVYQQVGQFDGLGSSVAVQEGTGSHYRQYSCLQSELHPGLQVTFFRNTCAAPTSTVTGTPPTRTATRTATATPNPCNVLQPWHVEAHSIFPRSRAAAAVANNQLYVMGGSAVSPTPSPNAAEKFDPATGLWSQIASSPDTIIFDQAAAVGNTVYAVGYTYEPGESFMLAYDTTANTWTRRATLPENLLNGALAVYNGKIYIFGGAISGQLPSDRTYQYDPATDTVTQRASMPHYQFEIGAAAIGNKIYVVGGYQYIHYAYDPAADSWTTIATPPTPSFSNAGVFTMGGELWVIGGYDNPTQRGYPPSQEVQIYNPTTNLWRYGPTLNTPRYYSTAAGVINNRAYLVGGVDLQYDPYSGHELTSMESIAYGACGTGTPVAGTPTRTATGTARTSTSTSTPTSTARASASVTRTRTPGPTTTPGGPTETPQATATACTVSFSDVSQDNAFYQYIRCLACRGIISGYFDGTFRPGNDITRGQIAKIVSNAAGFEGDPGPQLYEDVAPGSPFYDWINRLSNRGVMGGYECGLVPQEPCLPPANRPYFRPQSNATRGQLAKIVANAAGLTSTPMGQFYTDVPEGHPFYLWVMQLTNLGVMSGYPCGTNPQEPCDSEQRPYFRTYNNVTRGQASKIVANTFFPDCVTPQH